MIKFLKRKTWLPVAGILLLAGLCGSLCAGAQDSAAGKTVTQQRFQRMMKKKNAILLDVRTPGEFREGHIPGALLIDVMNPAEFKARIAGLDKKKTYLLYCRSGKRSHDAKVQMKAAGFKRLFDLEGGFSQWEGAKELEP